jgi:hypothetical protein
MRQNEGRRAVQDDHWLSGTRLVALLALAATLAATLLWTGGVAAVGDDPNLQPIPVQLPCARDPQAPPYQVAHGLPDKQIRRNHGAGVIGRAQAVVRDAVHVHDAHRCAPQPGPRARQHDHLAQGKVLIDPRHRRDGIDRAGRQMLFRLFLMIG